MPLNRFRGMFTVPRFDSVKNRRTPGIPKAVTAAKETHDAFSAPCSGSDFPMADGTASFSGAGFPLDLRPPVFLHRPDPSLALDDSGLLHLLRSRHDSRALSGGRVPFEVYCPYHDQAGRDTFLRAEKMGQTRPADELPNRALAPNLPELRADAGVEQPLPGETDHSHCRLLRSPPGALRPLLLVESLPLNPRFSRPANDPFSPLYSGSGTVKIALSPVGETAAAHPFQSRTA